jgi:trimeric autotransporter adhesin
VARPSLLLILLVGTSPAQQYILSTFAGNGPPTPAIATTDSVYPGNAVAVDASGDVLFTSAGYIFQVSPEGILTRFAGAFWPGFAGDGGPATQAQLSPGNGGLAIDNAGNVYVADAGNSRVRRISPAGIITTIAGNGGSFETGDGGPAVNATLGPLAGIVVDGSGNVFVADEGSQLVRKISPAGIATTVWQGTPTGSAGGTPGIGLALDSSGSLFISEAYHNTISKLSTDGLVTIIAGTGVQGFSGDGGPATTAQLSHPSGIVVDAAGNIYFTDTQNARVRKISTDGVITTIAHGGSVFPPNSVQATQATLCSPTALALDGEGNLYLSACWIQKISPDGLISIISGNGNYNFGGNGGPAINAQLWEPFDITLDAAGDAFISDQANQMVRKVDSNGLISTVAGNGHYGYSGDGGPATNASFAYPAGVATDSTGNLYVADSGNNCIRMVSPSGMITTVAGNGSSGYSGDEGPAIQASLNNPLGVTVDGAGNLFIADYQNNRIRKVSADGTITTVAGTGVGGFSGDGGPATAAQLFIPRA